MHGSRLYVETNSKSLLQMRQNLEETALEYYMTTAKKFHIPEITRREHSEYDAF